MDALAGPVWASLALLAFAGLPKVWAPYDTMRALRLAGLRVPAIVVRLAGLLEAVLGAAALLTGHPLLLGLAALSYLGFAGFVGYALRQKTPLASCGCFAKTDTPPTRLHVVIVAGLALALAGAALTASPVGLLTLEWTPDAVVAVGFGAIICWFCYLAMAVLPTARARPTNPAELTRAPAVAQRGS